MAGAVGAAGALPGLGITPGAPAAGATPSTGAGERTPGTPSVARAPAFAAVLAGAVGRAPARPAPNEVGEDAPAALTADPAATFAALRGGPPRDAGAVLHAPAPDAVGRDAEGADAGLDDDGTEPAGVDAAPADVPALPIAVPASRPLAPVPAAESAAPAGGPNAAPESASRALPGRAASRATTRGAVGRASRDPEALAPALRQRLGRVVARMRDEFGHDVDVAEAGRSQARQDHLFAQGRTRPGPVVTWTRNSEHTRGRAVDVTIDGGWDDTAAFAQLQRVAREEGLHTLGARDPGHLELPRGVAGGADAAFAALAAAPGVHVESVGVARHAMGLAPARPAPAEPLPPTPAGAVAAVAPVAAVAAVAQVASVATVAAPGGAVPLGAPLVAPAPVPARTSADASSGGRDDAPDAVTDTPRDATQSTAADGAPGRTAADPARPARPAVRERPRRTPADAAPAISRDAGGTESRPGTADGTAAPARLAAAAPAAPSAGAAPALGAVAAQRVADVLAAQEAGGPREVAHLTLRLDNAAGGEDRIRVDLRRAADGLAGADARVDARIDVADLGAADRLAARAGELRDALSRHGLGTDAVQVTSAAAPASVAGARGASSQDPASDAARDQSRDQRQDSRQDSRQDPRDPARQAQARAGAGGDGRRRDPRDGLLYDELAAPRGRA